MSIIIRICVLENDRICGEDAETEPAVRQLLLDSNIVDITGALFKLRTQYEK